MTPLFNDSSVVWVQTWNLNTIKTLEYIGIVIFAKDGIGCDFKIAMRDRKVSMPLLVLCKLFITVNVGLHGIA